MVLELDTTEGKHLLIDWSKIPERDLDFLDITNVFQELAIVLILAHNKYLDTVDIDLCFIFHHRLVLILLRIQLIRLNFPRWNLLSH